MPGLVDCGVVFFSRCLISPCSSHFDNHLYIDLAKPKSGAPLFVLFVLFVCLFFCWQLLICENTLIQFVKLKKQKTKEKNFHPQFLGAEAGSSAYEAGY